MNFARHFATVSSISSKYPPRKQLVWSECQNYLKKPILLLIQHNNLDTPSKHALKSKLGALGLSWKAPKPHILRKAIKLAGYTGLEGCIVGPTGVLLSSKKPDELQAGLRYLATQNRVLLVGGKIGDYTFSSEGIKDVIFNLPSVDTLRQNLVGLLQSPSMAITSTLSLAPLALVKTLDQHVAIQEESHK
jgi:ribosomal protein L10